MSEKDIEKLIAVNQEILKWIRVVNTGKVKDILETILDTKDKKIAYQLSDGKTTSTVIGNLITPHQTTVSEWWRTWYNNGIANSISAPGGKRAKRVFDLQDFGIPVPKVTKPRKKKNDTEG